jgi:hypothetical protein
MQNQVQVSPSSPKTGLPAPLDATRISVHAESPILHLSQQTLAPNNDPFIPSQNGFKASQKEPSRFSKIISLLIPTFLSSNTKSTSIFQAASNNEDTQFQRLKDKGYLHVAEQIYLKKGYPWEDIKSISNPLLMEQILQFYQLCCHKQLSTEMSKELIDFALKIGHLEVPLELKDDSFELENMQVLGQMIYLVNVDPNMAYMCIIQVDYHQAKVQIEKKFEFEMQKTRLHLQSILQAHRETHIQSASIAWHTQLPKEIAKLLLLQTGTLNIGIIDALIKSFIISPATPLNYEINLMFALKFLQRSAPLRAEINKIQAPIALPSNDIIRATLGLFPEDKITDFETKLTILSALFSHLRQAQDGSCFATSVAIEMLSSHLGFCFKDFQQILYESKLTRSVHHIRKDIPFIRRIQDEDLNKKIEINSHGYLQLSKRYAGGALWEAPGIKAACMAIGIRDTRQAVMDALKDSNLIDGNFKQLSINEILQKICTQKNPALAGQLFDQACFAFSSQTTHPLLKIWENAIATMSELQESSMIKKNILQSTLYALQLKLTQLKTPPSIPIQKFFLQLQKDLYESISLRYDPTAKWDKESKTYGGFILYQNDQCVDSQDVFINFIQSQLQSADQILEKREPENSNIYKNLSQTLLTYVKSGDFLHYTLLKYHPSNYSLNGEVVNQRFTPWKTATGNDSKRVLEVYLESENPLHNEHFSNESAEKRLIQMIQFGQKMDKKEKIAYAHNPYKMGQLRLLGHHTGSLMLGHPTLARAWQQEEQASIWLEKMILQPGKAIADQPIDAITRQNFLKKMEKEILPLFISQKNIRKYIKAFKSIADPISIKAYRSALLEIFQQLDYSNTRLSDKISLRVDAALCQSLEPILKKNWESLVIHFADTNWQRDSQDLHFCFVVNPGTGFLEMWMHSDDGLYVRALNQKNWLLNQEWEICQIPNELAPDDPLRGC